jgi:hypothetical protein
MNNCIDISFVSLLLVLAGCSQSSNDIENEKGGGGKVLTLDQFSPI